MPNKQEAHSSIDIGRNASEGSIPHISNDNDLDNKLKDFAETNSFYVHDLTWTEEEERRVVRIFDLRILSWTVVMFLFQQLDRTNIANALTDNLTGDLGFDLDTVSLGAQVFVIFYVLCEIPSNVILGRIGAHRWIPLLMTLWGLVTALQVLLHGRTSFLLCRIFIGVFEAGYIPGVALYLTTFYKRSEMAFRLAIFFSTLNISHMFSGFLAYGILRMRGIAGLEGWRWLFLIEGLATVLVGILSFFILPEGPAATKGYLRFNGYLTERQEQIAVTRLVRDDPTKVACKRRFISKKDIMEALKNFRLWPCVLIGLGIMPSLSIGIFAPLMIKEFGFDALLSNLMAVPGYLMGWILLSILNYSSDKRKDRAFHGALAAAYLAACVTALAALPLGVSKYSLYIALLFTMAGTSAWTPLNIAWIAENTKPEGKRSIMIAMYTMCANISSIPGTSLFRARWAPRFIPAMWVLSGCLIFVASLFVFQHFHLSWHNKRRAEITKDWSEADWEHYNATTTDYGDVRLDFRYSF